MEPATVAALAVGAVVRYIAGRAAGGANRAVDAAVDDRLGHLYEILRARLSGDRRSERTLHNLEAAPDDRRQQGRLEVVVETAIEDDSGFGSRLAAILEDLETRPPAGGVTIRDAGAVAGGDVRIEAGRDAAGRDLDR